MMSMAPAPARDLSHQYYVDADDLKTYRVFVVSNYGNPTATVTRDWEGNIKSMQASQGCWFRLEPLEEAK